MNIDIDGFQRGCKLEGLHPLLIVTYKNITISVSFPYYKFLLENRFYLQKKKKKEGWFVLFNNILFFPTDFILAQF